MTKTLAESIARITVAAHDLHKIMTICQSKIQVKHPMTGINAIADRLCMDVEMNDIEFAFKTLELISSQLEVKTRAINTIIKEMENMKDS